MLLESIKFKNIDLEEVNIKTHTLAKSGSNYYDINKLGLVPALRLQDGRILTETSTILEYFADTDKSNRFLPKVGNESRYFVLEKVSFIATEIHKSVDGWFKAGEGAKAHFANKIDRMLTFVDSELEGNNFIANNKLSIADFYLMTILLEIKYFADINNLEGYKNLYKYFNTMKKDKNIQKILIEEGLSEWLK